MSCKQRRGLTLFLFVVTVYFYTCQLCHSVSLGQREDGLTAYQESARWERSKQDNKTQQGKRQMVDQVVPGPNRRRSTRPGFKEPRPESAAFPREPLPYFSVPELDENGNNSLSWTIGNISRQPRSPASDSEDGYPADVAGFDGVQGKILGPSSDSSPHFSEWLAMGPLVQCHDNVMTFTATGEGFTHLLVDREGTSPISLFQLPPYCGYSVRTSWSDYEMMVPYDACYITQENGSYVLPLLWWGSPLKLSCPVQMSTPAPSFFPSVFCSIYGMVVQIHGQVQDIAMLGFIVNGGWGPFVSEECAYHVHSHPEELTFFISQSAQCITSGEEFYLQLVLDDQEYLLSCSVNPQFPYPAVTPGPTAAAKKTITTVPPATLPPEPPISLYYPQYHFQIPYYPAALVTQTPAALSPAPPKQPMHPQYPVTPMYPHTSTSSYYHYGHFFHPTLGFEVQPASTSQPTIASPFLPPPPTTTMMVTKEPDTPSYPFGQFYPQSHFYFPLPTPLPPAIRKPQTIPEEPQKPVTPQATCHPNSDTICEEYPYPYYPHLYPPHYQPPYPLVSQFPETQLPMTTTTAPAPTTTTAPAPTTTTTAPTTTTMAPTTSPAESTATSPTPQITHLQCLMGRMVVFLPFAQPESIQVRDQMKTWLFLSSVSPLCEYMLQMAEGSGVILHSPLPACHSQPWTPTTVSLSLRFWDLSMAQYRTLDLQCPYPTTLETPASVTPSVSPTPPSTIKSKISPSPVSKPEVFCSSEQMIVELPSGPISGIVVKDVKGNQINLQDPPKHCGYFVRKTIDGKIRLSLQLHSRCHMSVQGKMYIITVTYMTVNGRQEAQFSCPVVIPVSGRECNLPSEQRLPCGPGSVSRPQCLSMGCCFSKQPPACYYPMNECTIDRHFVFSVPASLTEPPLSPALLVAAGNSTCKPWRLTSDYALFKIPMDGCGTRRVMVGKTVIYMVEVINKVQALSLNYGTITRDPPIRLFVECRYLPSSVLSVSYMVKTPTLGPVVQTQGMFGVQLRIAKDAQYSSYYPQYHQPLQMLLGKPLYLEVRLLNSPDPTLVLLVHFCVAYPRSGKTVWLLLYNGCPNPLDPALQEAVLFEPRPPSPPAQTRRFTISTFQFLPDGEFKDPDEEIYFMCSTEICSPHDEPCVEGCFGQ